MDPHSILITTGNLLGEKTVTVELTEYDPAAVKPIKLTSNFSQFRYPQPDVVSIRIVIQTLLDHVELPIFARVIPDSGGVVPVPVIAAYIVIQLKIKF